MRPSQALDIGLTLSAVLIIITFSLLIAQAQILGEPPPDSILVEIRFDSAGAAHFSAPGVSGRFAEIRPQLASICRREVPPQISLRFPTGTLLEQAHEVYRTLQGASEVVCPVGY